MWNSTDFPLKMLMHRSYGKQTNSENTNLSQIMRKKATNATAANPPENISTIIHRPVIHRNRTEDRPESAAQNHRSRDIRLRRNPNHLLQPQPGRPSRARVLAADLSDPTVEILRGHLRISQDEAQRSSGLDGPEAEIAEELVVVSGVGWVGHGPSQEIDVLKLIADLLL